MRLSHRPDDGVSVSVCCSPITTIRESRFGLFKMGGVVNSAKQRFPSIPSVYMTKTSDVGSLQSWQGISLGFVSSLLCGRARGGRLCRRWATTENEPDLGPRSEEGRWAVHPRSSREAQDGPGRARRRDGLILQGSCHSGRSGPEKSGRTPQQIRDAAGSACGSLRRVLMWCGR